MDQAQAHRAGGFRRWLALLAAMVACTAAVADDATPVVCRSSELKVPQPAGQAARLWDTLVLQVSGGCRKKLEAQWATDPSRLLAVQLDGVEMKGLGIARPTQSPERAEDLNVAIVMKRDSNDPDSREAWTRLLTSQHQGYELTLPMTVSIGNDLPVGIDGKTIRITLVRGPHVLVALGLGLVFLVGGFMLLKRNPNALRDDPGGNYSLAKSQMAFWGLLVFACVACVWGLTQTLERITPQALVLLGISGATGVAAIAMGSQKRQRPELLKELEDERKELETRPDSLAKTARLKAIAAEADYINLSATPAFWRDLFSDGTGASFHRIQAVFWTLALGVVFIWTVATTMAMPEFANELLLLMGISNGTYLGFKFTEKG